VYIGSYHCFQPNIDQIKTLYSILTARKFDPPKKSCWKTTLTGMERMAAARTYSADRSFNPTSLFHDDYPVTRLTSLWADTGGASEKIYVVQTSETAILRCILSCTDPAISSSTQPAARVRQPMWPSNGPPLDHD